MRRARPLPVPADMITAAGLREQLFELAASGRPLVADLDQVSFIDSAGLGVLVGTANPRRLTRRASWRWSAPGRTSGSCSA